MNSSQNHSVVDSKFANYSSQMEEDQNPVSDSDDQGSISGGEYENEQVYRRELSVVLESGSQSHATTNVKREMGQNSSASVVYKYLKGSSSDMINKSHFSGNVSRRATSQLRQVRFKSSNNNISVSKGSSRDLDPFLKRIIGKKVKAHLCQ